MTRFIWEKKGKIFDPIGVSDSMQNYAQNPNAVELEDRVRVYFTTRPSISKDGTFKSNTSFVDLDRRDLKNVIYVHKVPVMKFGEVGEFDEFGIMPGSIIQLKEKNEFWLYYVGWTRMQSVPYNWAIGLAISKDGGYSFSRVGRGPIVGVTNNEPYLHACPRVIRKSEKEWMMWYQGGEKWNSDNGHMESVYVTKFATSENGIDWVRSGNQIIPSNVEEECQTSASVISYEGLFHMFFSYRHGINFRNKNNGYRIGYAYSEDGINWIRDDSRAGIQVSSDGWDSEMICYPHVLTIKDDIIMFYCGNYFGKYGFGYAVLRK
jgi:hypothetical protein